MTDQAYNIVAFGRQANIATAVAASTVFPVDAGFLGFQLDRGAASPNEDYGIASREYPGRESTGLRLARATLPFVGRFQDVIHALEMHVDFIGTPIGTASPYDWSRTFDESGNDLNTALKCYTIEYGVDGSTQDEWRAYGVIADTFDFGFDALTAPGNAMWKGSLGLLGIDREANAITGTATPPATLETMEGHLTRFYEGPVGTAFGSLSEVTGGLKQFQLRSANNAVGRAYGGTTDRISKWGRTEKGAVQFDGLVAISSTAKSDIHDIYNTSGSVGVERRWRIGITGSGVNAMPIDARVKFRGVDVGENDGERLYAVSGVFVYDSTLGGRGKFGLANAVATIP